MKSAHHAYQIEISLPCGNSFFVIISEAENTFRCGKEYIPLIVQKHYRPDSWLGALLGAKLYIDFSGKYEFEPKWNELIKELQTFKILTEGEDTLDSSEGK